MTHSVVTLGNWCGSVAQARKNPSEGAPSEWITGVGDARRAREYFFIEESEA